MAIGPAPGEDEQQSPVPRDAFVVDRVNHRFIYHRMESAG